MRLKKIRSFFFLFLFLMLPLSVMGQAPSPLETPQPVTVEEARQFIEEYKSGFMKMDLNAFMTLFSKEAVENRMLPYADIRDAYLRTISHCDSIEYQAKIYSIQTSLRSAIVRGRYQIIQSIKGRAKKKQFRGDIQWHLIRENGSLKIKEVNYGRDP